MAEETTGDAYSEASAKTKSLLEQSLAQAQREAKDASSLSLLQFLNVLLLHDRLAREVGAEQARLNLEKFHKKRVVLSHLLGRLAQRRGPCSLGEFEGVFDTPCLRSAITAHQSDVAAANKARKGRNAESPIEQPDWEKVANRLLDSKQPLYDWPVTPWKRIVGKLIGVCRVPMNEAFVCEWIARECEFSKSNAKAAELARLDAKGIQQKLLTQLREGFPAESAEWFGPPPSPEVDTFDKRLKFDETTFTIFLDRRSFAICDPRAFALYKRLKEQRGVPITRQELRAADKQFKGDKTIPQLRDRLPATLKNTVMSSTAGYWLHLPPRR
jgi:hypothetical protein